MGIASSAPWLKYYGNTPATLDYPHKTMYQVLAATARQYPNSVAYIFQGKETTYTTFMKRIDAAAKGLVNMGIRKGDKVTICMANTPQALDCFYALNRIGAIPNMIHPLSAAKEIAFYLNFSKSKAILTLAQFYDKVAEIVPELENPTEILIARIADELPVPLNLLYPLTKGGKADRIPDGKGFTLWYDMVKAGKVEDYHKTDFVQAVANYALSHPQSVMEAPQVTANVYPQWGASRVVELKFLYQTPKESLKVMQNQVSPIFAAAKLYVSGDTAPRQKFAQLYSLLMERYDYTIETSITPTYSLLCHGVGDSKAFSSVYAAMCRDAGLQCQIVSGTRQGEGWYWVLIHVNEKYYHVDLLNTAGTFQMLTDGQMQGYVWNYSEVPAAS